MRQFILLVITGGLALLLSACGGEEAKKETAAAAHMQNATEHQSTPAQPLPEAGEHPNADPEAALEPKVSSDLVD